MKLILLLTFLLAGCAGMRSGKYVKNADGEWIFISENSGLVALFDEDDTGINYWSGDFAWPVPSIKKISSEYGRRWGRMHQGVDIPARTGSAVVAADDAKVIFSGSMRGYGRMIILSHGKGMKTVYAHNSSLHVKRGQRVYRGQVIAKIGSTGKATGPHLHFEVRHNGQPTNPLKYFNRKVAKR